MTAYVIADVQMTDGAAYEPYRLLAAASITRFGGRFLVRGGPVELLEGRSGSSSSNSRTRTPRDVGTAPKNISGR